MAIERFIVSRDDTVYEAFPDLVLTESGKLICVFMENTHHSDRDKARITLVESRDRGRTWGAKRYLTTPGTNEHFYNCPRINNAPGHRLAITCDYITGRETLNNSFTHIWFGDAEGEYWNEPLLLDRPGIMPDKLIVLPSGRWLLGLQTFNQDRQSWEQYLYFSDNEGTTWSDRVIISRDPRYSLCEVSILRMQNGVLVAFMRENSKKGYDGMKAFSYDNGETWDGLYHTTMPGCHRPTAGYLHSGRVLVTHRFMQGGKGWFVHWSQNLFAALFEEAAVLSKIRDDQVNSIMPIDYDRARLPDCGYSGWVQFADGEIYIVSYIVDDAPLAQIRGYSIHEADFQIGF